MTPGLAAHHLAVFAAAQNMIYAGLEVCDHMVDHFGDTLGKWHALKEQFAAAEKDEAVSSEAGEHASLAVDSM